MEYVYPGIFHKNSDGTYTITYPDLPGCISEGKSLEDALYMAQSALTQWLSYLEDKKQAIPHASSTEVIQLDETEFCNLIRAEVKDTRSVKRTVSIPKWMDEKVIISGLSLSRVLQDALTERFTS
ncbi:MAG: type II toxin-antitoxin system HicB family antitoxin [Treponema sp.]|jgi:predicted RNase H-like HicB family nuclease|nr:type II toxin-antitoxin system HicB family antitoxin [Treponema sp.]